MLSVGDPAPWFTVRSSVNPTFQFQTVGGSYAVLCFFGSAGNSENQRLLAAIEHHQAYFNLDTCGFFGVSVDPDDERLGRVQPRWPGIIYFWDFDGAISRLYKALSSDVPGYQRHTVVLDPSMRALAVAPFGPDIEGHVAALLRFLGALPPLRTRDNPAPLLMVPNVFEPEFCRTLIALHEQHGGQEIGTALDVDGKTVNLVNTTARQRSDYFLTDPALLEAVALRMRRRLFPEIKKVFQFEATHLERYLVGCYDAASGGHFRKHRDHITRATAHRRFAVTINLNAEDYQGGDLRFPEFGWRTYRSPTGAALVFSCALMHEVLPVTAGKRYAFLPFVFDDAAARVREANLPPAARAADSLTLLWLQRRFDEVREKLEENLRRGDLPQAATAQVQASLAHLFVETGQIDRAEETLRKLPAGTDGLTEVLAIGAFVDAVQDKNLAEAERRLRSALEQETGNALYQSWLGLVLARQGRVTEGMQIMERAGSNELLASNPAFFDLLGEVYLLAGDRARARATWERGLHVFPGTAGPEDYRRRRLQEKLSG